MAHRSKGLPVDVILRKPFGFDGADRQTEMERPMKDSNRGLSVCLFLAVSFLSLPLEGGGPRSGGRSSHLVRFPVGGTPSVAYGASSLGEGASR